VIHRVFGSFYCATHIVHRAVKLDVKIRASKSTYMPSLLIDIFVLTIDSRLDTVTNCLKTASAQWRRMVNLGLRDTAISLIIIHLIHQNVELN